MSLGVLTNIAAIYAENNLNQTQASLQNTLQQLSSGSRINSGADDAAGLSVVDGLQANVSALTQSSQNASDGIGLLQTADGALSQVTNLLNRAVTLATEAANGTLNTNQVSSANAEYQNILAEIGDIGSTTNFNGNSVFTSTAKNVFVSDGTATGSDTYTEVVGSLSDGSVGVTAGTVSLQAPQATTPTATTTLQPAVALTASNLTTSSVVTNSSVSSTTASQFENLTTASNITQVAGSATYTNGTVASSYAAAGTGNAATVVASAAGVNASGGGPAAPSLLTGSATYGTASDNVFGAGDVYSGVVGVELKNGSTTSQLYTAQVAPGSSLATVVTALNNAFGNVGGNLGTSGLQAVAVNNALTIETTPGTAGQVVVDAPTNSLQVSTAAYAAANAGATSYTNVSFAGTGVTATSVNVATAATGAATQPSAVVSLGTGVVTGNVILTSSSGTALGTIAFGTGATGPGSGTAVGSTIGTALAAVFGGGSAVAGNVTTYTGSGNTANYTAAYNSSTGALTITGASGTSFDLSSTSPLTEGATTAVTTATVNTVAGTTVGTSLGTTTSITHGDNATIALGSGGATGNIVIVAAGAALGTIALGTGATQTDAQIQTLVSSFATTNSAALTTAGITVSADASGNITIANTNGGAAPTVGIYFGSAATQLSSLVAPTAPTSDVTVSPPVGTGTLTALLGSTPLSINNGIGSSVAITKSTGSLATTDTYSGSLTVSVAGSTNTYTTTFAAGTSLTNAIAELNQTFGSTSSPGGIGASGLQAVLNSTSNGIIIQGAAGDQVVIGNNSASNLQITPLSGSAVNSAYGGTTTTEGYTATAATTATGNSVAFSLSNGTAIATTAVQGNLVITDGPGGTGTALGTIAFGSGSVASGTAGSASFGASGVEAALATTFAGGSTATSGTTVTYTANNSTTLAGYSATYNGATGALTINGPTNGNSFSVTSGLSGATELEIGTVPTIDTTVVEGTTTINTGSGFTANPNTVYTGTITFGNNASSYAITAGGQTAAQIVAASAFQTAVATAGLQASNNNGVLSFSPTAGSLASSVAPTVTLTSGTATNPAVTTYTQSTATIAPSFGSGNTATFQGILQIGTGNASGLNGNVADLVTTFAPGTTAGAAATQLTNLTGFSSAGFTANAVNGNLVITGPAVTQNSTASQVAADQITFGAGTTLSGVTATTQTVTVPNNSANTTYTGTINYGTAGTTTAGSFVIGSNNTGTTAALIAQAFNAATTGSGATGITASVNNNELVFTGPSSGSSLSETPGITFTNLTATAPAQTAYSPSTASFQANVGGTFSGNLSVGTVATGQIVSTIAAGTTLANLVTQLNNQYTQLGDYGVNGITASAGTGAQAGELILTAAAPTSASQVANDTLTFSTVAGANTLTATTSTAGVNGGPGSGEDLSQANVATLTANSAQTVLSAITTAINDVAYQRGLIGADVNELTAASNVASAESVNLTSAQSSIQSTDYGSATSNLAKYQVLSQTGISALAQANSVSQEVLKLLQ
jgi:flagellin